MMDYSVIHVDRIDFNEKRKTRSRNVLVLNDCVSVDRCKEKYITGCVDCPAYLGGELKVKQEEK